MACTNGCGEKLQRKDVSVYSLTVICHFISAIIGGHMLMLCICLANSCVKYYCLQLAKHMRTVCTHLVRECDFKDIGCQFKVINFSYNQLKTLVILFGC